MMNIPFSGPAAGLVIRANAVELLALRGRRVVARVRVPIEGKETSHLAQAIRQAVAASGVKAPRLAVAIPTADVLVRFFLMPRLPRAEWDAAIQFEARKYIPFKTEALVWSCHTVELKESQKFEVVFTAIQRHIFQELEAVLAEAEVQPTRMESRSVSLARLAALPKGKALASHARDFVCLVDVEPEQAHLVIARDGVPYLTRDVALTEQAAGGEGDPKAQRLLSELRVSMDFFTREHPAATIPRVILVGEEALIGPWQPWLADQLQCAVEIGSDLLRARVDGELSLSFASAVGLVRAGYGGTGRSLDLLKRSVAKSAALSPGELRSAVIKELRAPHSLAIAGVAAAAVVACWLFGAHQVAQAQRQLEQIVGARPSVGWGLETVDQVALQPIQKTATRQLEILRDVVDGRVGVVAKLDALARSLPEGMWITRLTFEEIPDGAGTTQVSLKVSGACYLAQSGKELSAIRAFEERVKGTPALFRGFKAARVEQIKEQVGPHQYTYQTFQLDCRSGKEL